MGRYIVKSDVEDQFGIDNVIVWSDLSGTGSVDDNRINRAIDYAEDRIDDWFRGGRYAIPFVFSAGIPQTVKFWASVYAGAWLYRSRGIRDEDAGERINVLEKGEGGVGGVDGEIREYMANIRQLNAASTRSQPDAPVVVGVR